LKSVALTEVRRQTDRAYRDAIHELRRDPGLGFQKLDAIGSIYEVPWTDRPQAVAKSFAEFKSQGRDTLVVCATHDEIDRVTEAIRSFRKMTGQLRTGAELTRDVPLSWTAAQKRDVRNLRPGQILGFYRAVKGIGRNETAEVIRVDPKRAIVRTGSGELRAITSKQSKSFDVYDRRAIEVAAGDKLLITANRRTPGFRATNGEIVTVRRIDQQRRIHLDDGRVLPDNFGHFDHGYAVTAHRSQGKTVDAVIISADGMRKELFYVAASRGRERALVVTSNKEQLLQSVGRSAARQSATELERKLRRPGLHQGLCRGLAAARRLAMWVAQHFAPSFSRNLEPRQQIIRIKKERSHDFGMER
jgi:hypothetical protein